MISIILLLCFQTVDSPPLVVDEIPVRWATTETFPAENIQQLESISEGDPAIWMNPNNNPKQIVRPEMVSPNGATKIPGTLQDYAQMVFIEGYEPTCNLYAKVADDWTCQIMILGFIEAAQPSRESRFVDFSFDARNALQISSEVLGHNNATCSDCFGCTNCQDTLAAAADDVVVMTASGNNASFFVGARQLMDSASWLNDGEHYSNLKEKRNLIKNNATANEVIELVAWGDIDGDGIEDVLAKIHYDRGGSGNGDVCVVLEFDAAGVLVLKR